MPHCIALLVVMIMIIIIFSVTTPCTSICIVTSVPPHCATRIVPLANAACHPRGNDKSVVKSDDATTSVCQMIALNAEYIFFSLSLYDLGLLFVAKQSMG